MKRQKKANIMPTKEVKKAEKKATFKVWDTKLCVAAFGKYLANRFGKSLSVDDGAGKTHHKTELASKIATEGTGILLKELARKIALGDDVEQSVNTLFAVGHTLTEGKVPSACVKYAGTRLDNVTSEKQAQERVDIETFAVTLEELATHKVIEA